MTKKEPIEGMDPSHPTPETRAVNPFEIPEDSLSELITIARVIGGDWGMRVEVGEPGEGSFFNEAQNRIQFDPLAIADPERFGHAKFIAAHEGGHRAITRGPTTLGIPPERAAELYQKLGFAFGLNAVEDPADNNWWSRRYPGLEADMKSVYDQMFETDAAVLGTPEIHALIAKHGSAPRFAQFGSELIRLWHTGTFSIAIPDDVRMALKIVSAHAQNYFEDLPEKSTDEDEVISRGRSRFSTFVKQIWPFMDRLVQEDLKDEKLRELIKETNQSQPSPLDALPEELRQELEEAIQKASEDAADAIEKAAAAQAQQHEKDAEALRKSATSKRSSSAAGEADTEAEKADELEQRADNVRQAADAQKKALRSGTSPRPIPVDKFSKELREALEKIYKKLPQKDKQNIEAAARKKLEKIEDELNQELQSKLNPDQPESHQKRHERELAEAQKRQRKETEQQEDIKVAEAIQKAIEGERNVYDQALADVAPLIRLLADDIDRIFLPNRQPHWRGHFSTGGRLDLRKAMQFEARPEMYTQLWERKTIPEKNDFAITILVDLSGSMHGEKIHETFRGTILLTEALARTGIHVEVLGFQDELIEFKDFDQPMSDIIRSKMAGMSAEVTNTNPHGRNRKEWNDDGYAVKKAAGRLQKRSSKERFLIVFSDGEPEPSPAHTGSNWDLAKIVADIRAQKTLRLAGIGLGPGTEHVRTYYPNSIVVPDVKELPRSLAKLLEDILMNPNTF